jgi:hypothetical protein
MVTMFNLTTAVPLRRRSLRSARLGAALIVAVCLLAGCSPFIHSGIVKFHAESSLTLNQLEDGRVAFLPPQSAATSMLGDEENVVDQIVQSLQKTRPRVATTSQLVVNDALREDPEGARSLKDSPRTRELPADIVKRLGTTIGVRFIVLIVFEQYSAALDGKPDYEWIPSYVKKSTGEPVGYLTGTAVTDLVGTMTIFDASEGRVVWRATAKSTSSIKMERIIRERDAEVAQLPAPLVPLSKLMPSFVEELVDRWP